MNRKLGSFYSMKTITALTHEDLLATIQYSSICVNVVKVNLDDIDHLGNRRVRLVGELLTNQVYLGFLRIERIVRETFRIRKLMAH